MKNNFYPFTPGASEPFPKIKMSHGHRQRVINKDKSPASLWHGWPSSLALARSERASKLLTSREIQLWVVTEKRHSAREPPPPTPTLFQLYTRRWWEMNLPWLSLKGSAQQSSIGKSILCYKACARHSPRWCHSTAVTARKNRWCVRCLECVYHIESWDCNIYWTYIITDYILQLVY